MTDERWRHLEDTVHEALKRRGEERSNFIRAACRGDELLRREIESLLVNVGVADSRLGIGHSQMAIDGVSGDLIGHQIGAYRILSLLGVGGMGEVYRAMDGRLNREVALKVLPAEFALDKGRLARFKREAQILASLNHPHIAAIYGLEESDGSNALVLELVEGPTLADRIAGGAIPVDEVQPIVQQILEALEAAHEQGIIHRDLKPANIKVREDGTVKVLDFGLAKVFDSGPAAIAASQSPTSSGPATMTGVGVLLGTPAYMSPEQARGKPMDKRADLWAFGCVFYEMLTGRRAFAGDESTDAIASVLTRDPDWTLLPTGLSPVIGTYLKRCLQKNRKRRIAEAQTMRLAVEGAFETTVADIPTPFVTHLQMDLLPADSLTGSASPFFRFRPPRTAIALSPDGRLVVFSGKQGTLAQLYLRAFDQTEARPVPGTENASEPFFSPDGTWIGFTANNKIKKVPSFGGPPVTICDESLKRGAGKSWGQDGTILFAGIGGISKVSCAGGTPIAVTRSDASKGECHLFPHWLPGGGAILFTTVIADEWDTANTLVYSLDSGESRVIIPGGVDARYVDTGHVVYMKTSTLMAVSFDPRSQQVTGAPVALLEGVMQGMNAICGDDETGAGQFAVSRTGTLLSVAGGIGPMLHRSLVWVDRSGVQQPSGAPEWLYTAPRLAPDGQKIAFFSSRGATRTNDIWVYDVLRGAPIRLTFDGNNTFPIWSPDGKRLVYGSSTAGISNLYAINADGSGTPERLTTSNQVELPSSWASADNAIAFLRHDQSVGDHGIWVLPMDGDRTPRLFLESRFILEYPEFSPDGRWMAYVSDESGIAEVFVQPYPGPGEKIRISTSGGVQPIWTADGRELLYRARTPDMQQMFSVAIHSLSPFRADAPRLLFEAGISDYGSAAPIRGWDISADRQRFLFMGSIRSMPKPVTAIRVVQNWAEELKRLVPTTNRPRV